MSRLLIAIPYYYLTVSDNCETPENNDSILVTWHDLPTALFGSDTTGGCYPVQVCIFIILPISLRLLVVNGI